MVPRVLTHPHGYSMMMIRWEIGLTLSHFVFGKDMWIFTQSLSRGRVYCFPAGSCRMFRCLGHGETRALGFQPWQKVPFCKVWVWFYANKSLVALKVLQASSANFISLSVLAYGFPIIPYFKDIHTWHILVISCHISCCFAESIVWLSPPGSPGVQDPHRGPCVSSEDRGRGSL